MPKQRSFEQTSKRQQVGTINSLTKKSSNNTVPKKTSQQIKTTQYNKPPSLFPFSHELFGILAFGFGIYLFIAFLTPYAGDAGNALKKNAIKYLGLSALLIPSYFGMIGGLAFQYRTVNRPMLPVKFFLYTLWLGASLILLALTGQGGKLTQWSLGTKEFLGPIGSLIAAGTIVILLSFLITGVSIKRTARLLANIFKQIVLFPVKSIIYCYNLINKSKETKSLQKQNMLISQTKQSPLEILADPPKMAIPTQNILPVITEPLSPLIDKQVPLLPIKASNKDIFFDSPKQTPPSNINSENHGIPKSISSASVQNKDNIQYRLPHTTLFKNIVIKDQATTLNTNNAANENDAALLETTLKNFGVEAKVIHVEKGPTVTRYELQPAKGVPVRKIVALSNDIALALAAISIRIEAPIPGKSAIGIEVPNSVPSLVSLKQLLEHPLYKNNPSSLAIPFGCDIAGKPVVADLAKMPHLLIAGATGSGKTVCVNGIIASILFKATPDQVQFLMIDPKRVELTMYAGIPHLVRDVVTDPKLSARALTEAVNIMDNRYDRFAKERVRNILEYNAVHPDDPMPNLVIIIDELAELMAVASVMVETSIARLTATARAAGIHLIVATQRPSVDVITGTIKSNIPSRIAFAVSSQIDSRTILDSPGAEKLLGRGDMLFLPIDASKPVRLQGALILREEIEALVDFWSRQALPENKLYIPLDINTEVPKQNDEFNDELYEAAKEIILSTGQASVSILQRKMKIGYARAGRLIDILEKRGVVGPPEGSKPRKILLPTIKVLIKEEDGLFD